MENSSFWDTALDFSAKEASDLAVNFGRKPGMADPTMTKAVLERMEQSFDAKCRWYQKTDEGRCYSEEGVDFVEPDRMLESVQMIKMANQGQLEDDEAFLSWLRKFNWAPFDSQRFTREELARWFAAIGVKPRYSFGVGVAAVASGMEQKFPEKERLSLLKMVIVMAVRRYSYDPIAKKNPTANQIAEDAPHLKISIDEDTVRRYLNEAVDRVLPKDFKKP